MIIDIQGEFDIIVDNIDIDDKNCHRILGVNDLWTDPQIHSANGKDYGDGNLGIRGMALFLLSHK